MAACLDQKCGYLQATTLHENEITTAVTFSQLDWDHSPSYKTGVNFLEDVK